MKRNVFVVQNRIVLEEDDHHNKTLNNGHRENETRDVYHTQHMYARTEREWYARYRKKTAHAEQRIERE